MSRISANKLIENYEAELAYAKQMRANGVALVDAAVAGTTHQQNIDDYVKRWEDGLAALKNGADPELYNY